MIAASFAFDPLHWNSTRAMPGGATANSRSANSTAGPCPLPKKVWY